MSVRPAKLFLVWMDGEDEQYYNQYSSLEDAVSSEGDGVEVFTATPVSLGKFERSVKIVKSKKQKGSK